jgi:Rnl2 family RNA ligase
MIEFKKYSSIENSFNREFLEYVVAQMPADLQYVVQEKVHGANTSFLCDGHEVKFAKRTSALVEDEKFYEYPELLESYKERVLNLFVHIKSLYPAVKHISVFGEMFGGSYPHPEVKPMYNIPQNLDRCIS